GDDGPFTVPLHKCFPNAHTARASIATRRTSCCRKQKRVDGEVRAPPEALQGAADSGRLRELPPRSACWRTSLPHLQGKGVADRLHFCVRRNIEKTPCQPEVLEEWPEVLVPLVAVEWKAPEIVKQNCRGNDVKDEQQRRLPTIEVEQDAHG